MSNFARLLTLLLGLWLTAFAPESHAGKASDSPCTFNEAGFVGGVCQLGTVPTGGFGRPGVDYLPSSGTYVTYDRDQGGCGVGRVCNVWNWGLAAFYAPPDPFAGLSIMGYSVRAAFVGHCTIDCPELSFNGRVQWAFEQFDNTFTATMATLRGRTSADDDSLLLRLVSAPTPPVPEPSTAMLSLAGLLVLGLARAALRRG